MNRVQAIDLLRGLALLFLVVDHMPGSPTSALTLRNFAICDAAEVFVFLAGFGSAAAYVGISERGGTEAARRRFASRAWLLYLCYVSVALGVASIALFASMAGLTMMVVDGHVVSMAHGDLPAFLLSVATFSVQPNLSNVLPMYVAFAAATPLIMPALRFYPAGTLALSGWCWLMSRDLAAILPGEAAWYFNPFAWQVLFVAGALAALRGRDVADALEREWRALTAVSASYAITAAALAWMWRHPEAQGLAGQAPHPAVVAMVSKTELGLLRLLSFLSLAWLCWLLVRPSLGRAVSKPFTPLVVAGRNSLPCFAFGALVSAAVHVCVTNLGGGFGVAVAGDMAAVAATLGVGYLADRLSRTGPPVTSR